MAASDEIKVVVQISGGIVQSVHRSPGPTVVCVVIDHDAAGETAGRGGSMDMVAERETEGLVDYGFEFFPEYAEEYQE